MVRSVEEGLVLDPSARVGLSHYPPAEWLPRMEAERHGEKFVPPFRMFGSLEVTARVDAGRWIACCPFCGVHSWVGVTDPRLYCSRCHNAAVHGEWVPVVFPKNRLEIERVLVMREHEEQFWSGQTVLDLMGENIARGLAPYEGY